MGRRAAVVIGVNKTGDLTPLRAAVSGARDIDTWLRGEGFEVTCLVDECENVTIAAVKMAVRTYVDLQVFEQLVIYFAGHGYLNGTDEIWLLSQAPDDPDEAIDQTLSVELARSCGIPSVVMISDACRTNPPSQRGNRVGGSSAFPNLTGGDVDVEVDRYFATRPGDPALEMTFEDAGGAYAGLFTEMLRRVHRDPDLSLVRRVEIEGKTTAVVPSRRLKHTLPSRVTAAAEERSLTLRQIPQLRLECGEDTFIARARFTRERTASAKKPKAKLPVTVMRDAPAPGIVKFLRLQDRPKTKWTHLRAPRNELAYSGDIQDALRFDDRFGAAVKLVAAADKTDDFRTHSGVQITGAKVVWAQAIGMEVELLSNQETSIVRLQSNSLHGTPEQPCSVILQFDDGSGTVVAGLPGYIAAVAVDCGRVVNISYVPSTESQLWHDYQYERTWVGRLRAIAAAAARNGLLAGDRWDVRQLAGLIRLSKRFDPTLGLYASLAYASFGLRADIKSVQRYMRNDLYVDLFDILLLAGGSINYQGVLRLGKGLVSFHDIGVWSADKFRVVPFCPMLTQSWSYLQPRGIALPPRLVEAGRWRRPALWTTFDPDGVKILRDAVEKGRFW